MNVGVQSIRYNNVEDLEVLISFVQHYLRGQHDAAREARALISNDPQEFLDQYIDPLQHRDYERFAWEAHRAIAMRRSYLRNAESNLQTAVDGWYGWITSLQRRLEIVMETPTAWRASRLPDAKQPAPEFPKPQTVKVNGTPIEIFEEATDFAPILGTVEPQQPKPETVKAEEPLPKILTQEEKAKLAENFALDVLMTRYYNEYVGDIAQNLDPLLPLKSAIPILLNQCLKKSAEGPAIVLNRNPYGRAVAALRTSCAQKHGLSLNRILHLAEMTKLQLTSVESGLAESHDKDRARRLAGRWVSNHEDCIQKFDLDGSRVADSILHYCSKEKIDPELLWNALLILQDSFAVQPEPSKTSTDTEPNLKPSAPTPAETPGSVPDASLPENAASSLSVTGPTPDANSTSATQQSQPMTTATPEEPLETQPETWRTVDDNHPTANPSAIELLPGSLSKPKPRPQLSSIAVTGNENTQSYRKRHRDKEHGLDKALERIRHATFNDFQSLAREFGKKILHTKQGDFVFTFEGWECIVTTIDFAKNKVHIIDVLTADEFHSRNR